MRRHRQPPVVACVVLLVGTAVDLVYRIVGRAIERAVIDAFRSQG